jgi:hypothetical protein
MNLELNMRGDDMKRFAAAVVLALCTLTLASCHKRFIGDEVGFAGDNWCHYAENVDKGFKRCIIKRDWVEFDFQILKGEKAGEWLIEGTVDLSKGVVKSASSLNERKSKFSMLVASKGIIVDNVAFQPVFTGNIGDKMPFSIRYVREEGFSLITFYSYVQVRG